MTLNIREILTRHLGPPCREPTDADLARLSHVVEIPGLTPADLDPDRCAAAMHAVRRAAREATDGDFLMQVSRSKHDGRKTGYRVHLPDAAAAECVRAAADAVMHAVGAVSNMRTQPALLGEAG